MCGFFLYHACPCHNADYFNEYKHGLQEEIAWPTEPASSSCSIFLKKRQFVAWANKSN